MTRMTLAALALGFCAFASGCGNPPEKQGVQGKHNPGTAVSLGKDAERAAHNHKQISEPFSLPGQSKYDRPDSQEGRTVREKPVREDTPLTKEIPLPLPKLGKWLVRGKTRGGQQWTAVLVFTRNIDERKNAGYFDWTADGGGASGREHFYGVYDPRTRIIHWKGYRIENGRGNIVHANYQARLSKDKKHLTDGTWSGNGSIPGTWTAEWKEAVKPSTSSEDSPSPSVELPH